MVDVWLVSSPVLVILVEIYRFVAFDYHLHDEVFVQDVQDSLCIECLWSVRCSEAFLPETVNVEEVFGKHYPCCVWPYIKHWIVVEHECQHESTKEEWSKMQDKGAWHTNDGVALLVALSNHEDFDQLAFLCFSCAIVLDDG